jgi:hypothetical protein
LVKWLNAAIMALRPVISDQARQAAGDQKSEGAS